MIEEEPLIPIDPGTITTFKSLANELSKNWATCPNQAASHAGLAFICPGFYGKAQSSDLAPLVEFVLQPDAITRKSRWTQFWGYWQNEEDARQLLGAFTDRVAQIIASGSLLNQPTIVVLLEPLIVSCLATGSTGKTEDDDEHAHLKWIDSLFSLGVDMEHHKEDLFAVLPPNRHPIGSISQSALDNAYTPLRMAMELYVTKLHSLFLQLFKHSSECKEQVFAYLDGLLYANLARAKLVLNEESPRLLSDGASMVLWLLYWKLVEPICANRQKADLILDDYWATSPRRLPGFVRSEKCTRVQEWKAPPPSDGPPAPQGKANFVSECFFPSLFVARFGPVRLLSEMMDVQRELHRVGEEIKRVEEAFKSSNDPYGPMNRMLLARMKAQEGLLTDKIVLVMLYTMDIKSMGFQGYLFLFACRHYRPAGHADGRRDRLAGETVRPGGRNRHPVVSRGRAKAAAAAASHPGNGHLGAGHRSGPERGAPLSAGPHLRVLHEPGHAQPAG